jgi:signal transduction histidine kinase
VAFSRSRKLAFALCLALLAGSAIAAGIGGQRIVSLDPGQDRIPLWSELSTVGDPEGKLQPEQVDKMVDMGEAKPVPHANHAFGKLAPYPYWARVAVHNPDSQAMQWFMTYEFPIQDVIQVWTKSPGGGWRIHPALEQTRPLSLGSGDLYPTWRFELAPGQQADLLVRIEGQNMMRFPLFMLKSDTYAWHQRTVHLAIGFILAVPLMVMLYVLTLIPVADDRSLPLYLAMAVFELIGVLWVSGMLHETIPWIDREIGGWIGWIAYDVALGISCRHARVFMDTGRQDRLADKILLVLMWSWFASTPLYTCVFPEFARATLLWCGTAHAFILTWLAGRAYARQRSSHMGLFFSAWAVYAAAGVLYVVYRLVELPIYVTLISHVTQGAIVAALIGCAVSVQIVGRSQELRRQMEREQARALLYEAAHHDLRQPIQSIGLFARSLENADEEQRKQLLKGMDAAMTSINDFMAGLQHMSGRAAPAPQLRTVWLDDILRPIVEEYRHWCQSKHVMLRYRPLKVQVTTDAQYLQRIARNLLSNAMRYTDAGGRILVGGRRKNGQRWLVVADTGIGMTQDQADQCFEAFKRFGDIEKVPEGMGIGLYSVKQMALALGLQTGLQSTSGAGTVVSVSLATHIEASA